MKYVSATDILSDFKKTVDSHFVNSLEKRFILFFFSCSKKKGESIIMTHQEIGIYEINRISYLGKGYMYWVDTCLFLSIE